MNLMKYMFFNEQFTLPYNKINCPIPLLNCTVFNLLAFIYFFWNHPAFLNSLLFLVFFAMGYSLFI